MAARSSPFLRTGTPLPSAAAAFAGAPVRTSAGSPAAQSSRTRAALVSPAAPRWKSAQDEVERRLRGDLGSRRLRARRGGEGDAVPLAPALPREADQLVILQEQHARGQPVACHEHGPPYDTAAARMGSACGRTDQQRPCDWVPMSIREQRRLCPRAHRDTTPLSTRSVSWRFDRTSRAMCALCRERPRGDRRQELARGRGPAPHVRGLGSGVLRRLQAWSQQTRARSFSARSTSHTFILFRRRPVALSVA